LLASNFGQLLFRQTGAVLKVNQGINLRHKKPDELTGMPLYQALPIAVVFYAQVFNFVFHSSLCSFEFQR